jgi:ribosomal protein S6
MAKNQDETQELEQSDDASRVYELGFHLDPELPTEEVKKAYQTVRALIEEYGAVVAEGEPVKIPLAYTISRQETTGRRDFDSAYFSWIAYETSAARHEDIIAAAGAEKRIVRFIDLSTTKDAARNAAELRDLAEKTEAGQGAHEGDAADAELDAALENAAA